MFTGIIEAIGKVVSINDNKGNKILTFSTPFTNELKVDQSLAHNGVCLTVTEVLPNEYKVVAIEETLKKTNLGYLNVGDSVNLERCMKLSDRLDGHLVQGHVDQTAICYDIKELGGSWLFTFQHHSKDGLITVEKGSICVNGVSLTVVNSTATSFSVAIIPYTFDNTTFRFLKKGDVVNLEFDIIGKYIARLTTEKA